MNEEIKAASVDSPKFHNLAMDYRVASIARAPDVYGELVSHINAWADERTAQARQEAYEHAARVCETRIDPTRPNTASAYAFWHATTIRALASEPASRAMLPVTDWKIDGGLIYRLNDEGVNCDEINVTMANGSRSNESRNAAAQAILAALASPVAGWVSVEKDAARYRWLREAQDLEFNLMSIDMVGETLDAAIDEAMTAPPAPVTPKQEQS